MCYYNEAQLFIVYIFNRMVHSGATKSPYELIYKRIPDFEKIKPFGCIDNERFSDYLPNDNDNDHTDTTLEDNNNEYQTLPADTNSSTD